MLKMYPDSMSLYGISSGYNNPDVAKKTNENMSMNIQTDSNASDPITIFQRESDNNRCEYLMFYSDNSDLNDKSSHTFENIYLKSGDNINIRLTTRDGSAVPVEVYGKDDTITVAASTNNVSLACDKDGNSRVDLSNAQSGVKNKSKSDSVQNPLRAIKKQPLKFTREQAGIADSIDRMYYITLDMLKMLKDKTGLKGITTEVIERYDKECDEAKTQDDITKAQRKAFDSLEEINKTMNKIYNL
ncbi:hypothetical protein IJG72_08210 [bacterium]|nr:hypothetical protein [bacterium]